MKLERKHQILSASDFFTTKTVVFLSEYFPLESQPLAGCGTAVTYPTPLICSWGWVPASLVFTLWYVTMVATVLSEPMS